MNTPLEFCSKGNVIEIEFLPSNALVCIKEIGNDNQIISSRLIDTKILLTSLCESEKISYAIIGYSFEDTVVRKTKISIDTVINDLMLHLCLNNICLETIKNITKTVFDFKLRNVIRKRIDNGFLSINAEFKINPNICDTIEFAMLCVEQTNKTCIIRIKADEN